MKSVPRRKRVSTRDNPQSRSGAGNRPFADSEPGNMQMDIESMGSLCINHCLCAWEDGYTGINGVRSSRTNFGFISY